MSVFGNKSWQFSFRGQESSRKKRSRNKTPKMMESGYTISLERWEKMKIPGNGPMMMLTAAHKNSENRRSLVLQMIYDWRIFLCFLSLWWSRAYEADFFLSERGPYRVWHIYCHLINNSLPKGRNIYGSIGRFGNDRCVFLGNCDGEIFFSSGGFLMGGNLHCIVGPATAGPTNFCRVRSHFWPCIFIFKWLWLWEKYERLLY